jgi:23S rRNA (cytidine1920-2'-O)/16S rRNA (cytidine1409-2'-O)-methyltransferase
LQVNSARELELHSMKLRLDKWLVDFGLAPTRARAQELIASGQVTVDGAVVAKASLLVGAQQTIQTAADNLLYVSRGGIKLAAALDTWKIDVSGRVCLDIGISTGGFSDCLLRRGAARVIGIDSGHGQLAASLQADPRLHLLEHTNARHLTQAMLPAEEISFFAMDVSFIAASLVLPAVIEAAFPRRENREPATPREAVVLVKPQFESGREFVGKGGIVRSGAAHRAAVERVRETVCAHGALETRVMESPVTGGDGNREFLLYARF